MLDKITFADKSLSSTIQQNRLLSDTNINEIKTVVNNLVDHVASGIGGNYLSAVNPVGSGYFIMSGDISTNNIFVEDIYIDGLSAIIGQLKG